MATKKTYIEVANNENYRSNLVLKVAGRKGQWIECEGYEDCYILDEDLPEGKYSYYCRHKECNLSLLISIKKEKGLTCNFWGCIVTDEPIDFGEDDEVLISRMINDTDNHDVVMVFGSEAVEAYQEQGVKGLCKAIDNGDGAIVHRSFYCEDQRKAYLQGIEDGNGWEESCIMSATDIYRHYKKVGEML